MKKLFQYIGMLLGVAALCTGCESDIEKTTMSMQGECRLMATATEADITIENYQTPVLQLAWTIPSWYSNDDTRKTAGVGVTSYVQASASASFDNFTETAANGLSMTFTAGNLNSTAKKLAMEVGKKATLYMRVKCLEGGNIDVYSNVCEIQITPLYINMSKMAVLDQAKTDTIAHLASPAEDGVYAGFMYATAWMNCWFAEADGNVWGNVAASGSEFELSSEGTAWNCWFPDATGDFYVKVNTAKGWWSATNIETLTANGQAMSYNKKMKEWQLLTELSGQSKLVFAATGKTYDTTTRTDKELAKATNITFGFSDNKLVVDGSGEATVSGTGTHTISVSIDDDGQYVYKVVPGDQTQTDEPSTPKPTELKLYDKEKTEVLSTLAKTADGIYSGSLEAKWGWFNFLVFDAENTIWYGSDPTDATTLSSEEGFYNLWIPADITGIFTITVDLNTMKWSYERTGDLPNVFPNELKVIQSNEEKTVLGTLSKTADGVYSSNIDIAAGISFKIVDEASGTWYGCDPNDNTTLSAEEGNYSLWVEGSEDATYTISVDLNTMKWSYTKVGGDNPDPGTTYPTELQVYTSADWSNPSATLAYKGEGVFEGDVVLAEGANFKIVVDGTWYGCDATDNTILSSANDSWNMWVNDGAGTYTLTVNWDTKKWSATKKTE